MNTSYSPLQQAHDTRLIKPSNIIKCPTPEEERQQQQKVTHPIIYKEEKQSSFPMPMVITPCRHACRNRDKCKHLCCKDDGRPSPKVPSINGHKEKPSSKRFASALKLHALDNADREEIRLTVGPSPVETFVNFIQGFSSRYQ